MAAVNATMIALGKSGRQYVIDTYLPDAVATMATFNPSGAAVAGSTNYWQPPEDCIIRDIAMVAGPTATGGFFTNAGATINGATMRYAMQLTSVNGRTPLNVQVPRGANIGITQF